MRIEQLEYLAAVTEHGSLRRASEAMHISQPALSEAVTKLEKELGTTLLDRRRTGSRISRQGLDLLQNMTEVLEAVDRLRQAAGQQSARRRDLRIGTVVTASASLLAPALRDLHARHGSGGVEVVNGRQVDIQQGLAEGSLDLGLVNVLPGDEVPPTLVADRLIEGTPVACLPVGHPLAAKERVTVDDLRAEPHVLMRPGFVMHRYAHRLFAGSLPGTTYATDGAEMGKAMVAAGLGHLRAPRLLDRRRPARRGGRAHHASHPDRPDDGDAADAAPSGRAGARAAARPAAGAGAPGPDLPVLDRAAGHRVRPGHRGPGGAGRGPDAGDADQPRRGEKPCTNSVSAVS